jgi:hypothetical protein
MTATHFPTGVKVRQFTPQFQYSIIALILILMSVFSVRALTQDGHLHAPAQSK